MADRPSDTDEFRTETNGNPTDDLAGLALPHSSGTWKVPGESDAAVKASRSPSLEV